MRIPRTRFTSAMVAAIAIATLLPPSMPASALTAPAIPAVLSSPAPAAADPEQPLELLEDERTSMADFTKNDDAAQQDWDSFGSWTAGEGTASLAAGPDGSGAVRLESRKDVVADTTTTRAGLQRHLVISGIATVSARVRVEDLNTRRQIFGMHTKNPSIRFATLFEIGTDGRLTLADKRSTRVTITVGTWHEYRAVLDHRAGTYDAVVDGVLVASAVPILEGDNVARSRRPWATTESVRISQVGDPAERSISYVDDVAIVTTSRMLRRETLPDGWSAYVAEGAANPLTRESAAHDAPFVARLDAGRRLRLSRTIAAEPGRAYAFERTIAITDQQSVAGAALRAQLLDSEGRALGTTVGAEPVTSNNPAARLAVHVRAPASAALIRVELDLVGPAEFEVAPAAQDVAEPMLAELVPQTWSSSLATHPVAMATTMRAPGRLIPDDRPIASTTSRAEELARMTSSQRYESAVAQNRASRTSTSAVPDIELDVRRLFTTWDRGNRADARLPLAARDLLLALADSYADVPYRYGGFMGPANVIPIEAVYVYDQLYSVVEWTPDERHRIESWFRQSVVDFYNLNKRNINNITPYGLRHAFGTASVLNDPYLVRLMLPLLDELLSGAFYHSDGMWEEESVSYGTQVHSNVRLALEILSKNVVDPPGYIDERYGWTLDKTDVIEHFPMLARAQKAESTPYFPNGQLLPINDTWAGNGSNASGFDHTSPLVAGRLNDWSLNGTRLFGLTAGSLERNQATQITLNAMEKARGLPYGGGHTHADHLGITLWGSGVEQFSVPGYPKRNAPALPPNSSLSPTAAERAAMVEAKDKKAWFNHGVPGHNVPWVWQKDAKPAWARADKPTRPSIVASDFGSSRATTEVLRFVEASEPGPVGEGAEMKRRAVALVNLPGGRSYALDIQRLRGGDAHQTFLRANEQEDTRLDSDSTTVPLQDQGAAATVASYLASDGGEPIGLPLSRELMTHPRTASGSKDFAFAWTSEPSGSTVRAHMNGVADDQVIFSTIPTLRRSDYASDQDDFPGEHFQRLTKAVSGRTTIYGAVYETTKKDEIPIVNGVQWLRPDDGDPLTIVAKVTMDGVIDYVYFSDDVTPRVVEGITFSGRVAMVRTGADRSTVLKGYSYGGGSVQLANGLTAGGDGATWTGSLSAAVSANDGTARATVAATSTLTVDSAEPLPHASALAGQWVAVRLADGTGWSFPIERVEGHDIHVRDWLPFALSNGVATRTFAHFVGKKEGTVPGPVTVSITTGG